ncbi:MAG TPA: protein-glutamate O-methyltransferase [Tepidisphaeraceae bacterium]|nr:protein-glutamate O-methyltransferase [Tepidisphaeraceae bacterium]
MPTREHFQIDNTDFQLVREVVYKHCGISLGEDKRALVQARVARQVRLGGFNTASEYLESVLSKHGSREFVEFIDAISTNLTSFFRESDHFKYLLRTELPRLIAKKQSSGDGRILAWSAACSSGEEPYSLTMTLLDAIGRVKPGRTPWDLRVLATDISTKMVATARAGIYEESKLATVPLAYRDRFFTASGHPGRRSVVAGLRNIVRFRHLNLMDQWPFKGPFDFIFCRNVMIYFDKETQQRLVARFASVLAKDGLLFTGHSESLSGTAHRFANRAPAVYQVTAA